MVTPSYLMICSELNNPTLPHIKQWLSNNPLDHIPCWEAATSIHSTGSMFRGAEYAVFIYDKHAGIRVRRTHLLEPRKQSNHEDNAVARSLRLFCRSPCPALCKVRGERFVIVSVHLKAQGLRHSRVGKTAAEVQAMTYLVKAFRDTQPVGTHLIVIGDFNLNPDHEGLKSYGLSSILPGSQPTTVAVAGRTDLSPSHLDSTPSQSSSSAYDNAWISASLLSSSASSPTAFYTGDCGVITMGLKHPLIPNDTGAGANGFISDHCPIWFDLMIP
ncbi:unnamed protein product [Echinostoma caproni]|uniref:Endo/exonuclease/phosphatase domain-containing protein n=1 Tax=Echinostoma caproni TaxID=27848 RepID=A0A183AKQ7_9TREM|nr:unnamed protein product [Echinostoma caproni]